MISNDFKKRWFISIIFLFILIGNVSADLGTFPKGECVDVKGQINASSATVTIYYPKNSSVALYNATMSIIRGEIFNYTFCNTETLGVYVYDYCDIVGSNCVENSFTITASGFDNDDSFNRAVFFLYGVAALFFVGFIFVPSEKTTMQENGMMDNVSTNFHLRWTLFLFFVMFLMLGTNITFLSIYNYMGDTDIGAVFDKLAMGSMYFFWFSFGLLLFFWVFATISSLADKKRMRQARDTGLPVDFGSY